MQKTYELLRILILLSVYIKINLLINKSQIALVKNMTISRSILLEKLVLSRLMNEVKITIEKEVKISDIFTGLMIHTLTDHG